MRIAVVGVGSIGKRHIENIEDLGHKVVPIDIGDKYQFDVDAAFICTPTQAHVTAAVEYIRKDVPLFIEKPITYSFEQLVILMNEYEKNPVLSMVGCNMRFHPALLRAKQVAESKKVICARAEFGYYLPFWRKGDYKKSYSASEYGGILLDDIHEVDYLTWLFGDIKHLNLVCGKVGDLDIVKEDIAEIGIMFKNGVSASVHCDYLMKNYHRTLDLHLPHEVITYKLMPTNLMYKKEVEYFLSCIKENKEPMNGIRNAAVVTAHILKGSGNNTGKAYFDKAA